MFIHSQGEQGLARILGAEAKVFFGDVPWSHVAPILEANWERSHTEIAWADVASLVYKAWRSASSSSTTIQ